MCEIDDVQKIKDCLDIVEEWISKQDHLVEASKYISEFRKILYLPDGALISFSPYYWHYVPLPKLHPVDQSRVMVTQFLTDKLDPFSILSYFRYCFLIGEYRINYDYTPSERFVIDLTNIHFGLLSKLNPIVIKKSEVLCTEGIGTKIKGIHILNAPPFIDKLIFILKQALREKVANRVHVHSSYEDLQKHIPREILPKDYGGDDQSVAKLSGE
ncbi:hypothetical protein HF086_016284 [Spodoptera exigua]|uniref:CRAL-TRIO domain-containing protein n=1 Tax=Spodoptera exigua TaxID=7107 RepID=A0A922MHF8_SPOEX|nr:hypothetical protein HF086_016284 [Spodoptera exigua]